MSTAPSTTLLAALRDALPADRVEDDRATLARLSGDLSLEPALPAAVAVRPHDTGELAAALRCAHAAGAPVVARGGARSYTRAHTPAREGTLLLDLRALDRVVDVRADDGYVVVQAGCTWERLLVTLDEHGVRTPSWGPLSGRHATVGGSLSQNAAFFGSAGHGSVADGVLGLTVVLADGTVVRTGSWAHRDGTPFSRTFGPDLTGLFLADAGTHAVKAEAALTVVLAPGARAAASFVLPDAATGVEAMGRMARLRTASELLQFDPYYHRLLAGMGFEWIRDAACSVHVVCEGRDARDAEAKLAAVRGVAGAAACERDGSAALALLADPFGAARQMFAHADPGAHLPVHALVPASKARVAVERMEELLARRAPELERVGATVWTLGLAVGPAVLLECTLVLDPDAHERGAAPGELALRRELAALWDPLGAVHMQLGKLYAFGGVLQDTARETLAAVRLALDPHGLLNPGAPGA